MRILSASVISVQGHHLSSADVIAPVDSYVIEVRVDHDHSIRSLELDLTGRRLSCISWRVRYAIYSGIDHNPSERGMDLDMPAMPVFVGRTVCPVEPLHPLGSTRTAHAEAVGGCGESIWVRADDILAFGDRPK